MRAGASSLSAALAGSSPRLGPVFKWLGEVPEEGCDGVKHLLHVRAARTRGIIRPAVENMAQSLKLDDGRLTEARQCTGDVLISHSAPVSAQDEDRALDRREHTL